LDTDSTEGKRLVARLLTELVYQSQRHCRRKAIPTSYSTAHHKTPSGLEAVHQSPSRKRRSSDHEALVECIVAMRLRLSSADTSLLTSLKLVMLENDPSFTQLWVVI